MHVIVTMPDITIYNFQSAPAKLNELIHVKDLSVNCGYFGKSNIIT